MSAPSKITSQLSRDERDPGRATIDHFCPPIASRYPRKIFFAIARAVTRQPEALAHGRIISGADLKRSNRSRKTNLEGRARIASRRNVLTRMKISASFPFLDSSRLFTVPRKTGNRRRVKINSRGNDCGKVQGDQCVDRPIFSSSRRFLQLAYKAQTSNLRRKSPLCF